MVDGPLGPVLPAAAYAFVQSPRYAVAVDFPAVQHFELFGILATLYRSETLSEAELEALPVSLLTYAEVDSKTGREFVERLGVSHPWIGIAVFNGDELARLFAAPGNLPYSDPG